jgi:hypothetical protein
MNSEKVGIWKETTVAYFEVLSQDSAGDTEKRAKNCSQDSR